MSNGLNTGGLGMEPSPGSAGTPTGAGPTDPTTPTARKRWPIVVAIVAAVVVIAVIVSVLLTRGATTDTSSTASPTPTAASPAASVTPTPTATPSSAPSTAPVETVALPTDCYKIFDAEYLSSYGSEELNSPLIDPGISNFADVEALRLPLPGIECHWGGPTEGGTRSSVNAVDAAQQAQMISILAGHGATCAEWEQGVKCRTFERETENNPENWYIAEEYYFRDGLMVSSWLAGTVGDENTITTQVTSSIVGTLWS